MSRSLCEHLLVAWHVKILGTRSAQVLAFVVVRGSREVVCQTPVGLPCGIEGLTASSDTVLPVILSLAGWASGTE